MSDKPLAVEDAFVTTEDRCSHCQSKLTNAQTSRLNWQAQACKLNLKVKELEAALEVANNKANSWANSYEITNARWCEVSSQLASHQQALRGVKVLLERCILADDFNDALTTINSVLGGER